ncbi:MAG: alpha-1,2-fucosyltransferase [Bacteroidota bacterium]|jgi:hypothetical protein
MLVFHSHCQLGNQMFIYAAARSLSKARKLPYALSELGQLKNFRLSVKDKFLNAIYFNFFKLQNKLPGGRYMFKHLQDSRKDYSTEMIKENASNVWYYGYFQSEKYMYGNSDELRKLFRMTKAVEREFQLVKEKYLSGFRSYGTVHIRLKDYRTFGPDFLKGPDLTLPFSYYHQLLEKHKDEVDRWIILSDEPDLVKSEFAYLGSKAIFSDFSQMVDFQIIMHANICINAHSTFSWWASWLNSKQDKKVFVPDYFLGFKVDQEFPVHIIPPQFIRIRVE